MNSQKITDDCFDTLYDSPFGIIRIRADEEGVLETDFLTEPSIDRIRRDSDLAAPLQLAVDWLDLYFEGGIPDPDAVPLHLRGTAFQQEVWGIVRRIPYGEVLSYGEIARMIAARRGIPKMAAQAVGGAMRRCPIGLFIPCHRVVGSTGEMVGYGPDGTDFKRALLRHEGILWA